jgi:hypothetical protein
VTITGANLANASRVNFGSAAAAITSDTDGQITVTSPAGSAGTVDVTVTTPGGTSAITQADQFAYQPPPAVVPQPATTSTSSTATFTAKVNPGGLLTTVHWEYGLDASYRGPGFSGNVFDQSTPREVVASDSSDHVVTLSVSHLIPDALYHVRLVASNASGTTVSSDLTFRTPRAPSPQAPVIGRTENAAPVGSIFVLQNGKFVPLTEAQQLPSGTVVDALKGSVNITVATGVKGKTFTATFAGAVFKITQARSGPTKGLTTLSLVDGAFAGAPSYQSCKAGRSADGSGSAHAARLSSRILQTLRSRERGGRFRSVGRYAAGTVLGTVWDTIDRCDGTEIVVHQGIVTVTDFVHHRTIRLHAGQRYLARAR